MQAMNSAAPRIGKTTGKKAAPTKATAKPDAKVSMKGKTQRVVPASISGLINR